MATNNTKKSVSKVKSASGFLGSYGEVVYLYGSSATTVKICHRSSYNSSSAFNTSLNANATVSDDVITVSLT